MTALTGKSKKLANVKNKNLNRSKKIRKDVKKISSSRKIKKSDEVESAISNISIVLE